MVTTILLILTLGLKLIISIVVFADRIFQGHCGSEKGTAAAATESAMGSWYGERQREAATGLTNV